MTDDTDMKAWSEKIADLAVDALVHGNVLRKEQFSRARDIVAEEILVRLCLGDLPPRDTTPPK
jgi:hypothetical protein